VIRLGGGALTRDFWLGARVPLGQRAGAAGPGERSTEQC
jgi:hypothetical protein